MSEPDGRGGSPDGTSPDGWTTPAGWGGPGEVPAPSPASVQAQQYGQAPPYGQAPQYGQAPPYGQGGQPFAGQPAQPGWGPRPPELRPGVVPLRPLGLGEVLDGAVGVLRRYPRPALGLAAIIAVITVLIETLVTATALRPLLELDPAAIETGSEEAFTSALGGAFAGGAVAIVLALVSGAVLSGAITAVVGKAVLGQPMTLAEAWAAVRPVALKLIALAILTGLVVVGVMFVGFAVSGLLFAVGSVAVAVGVLTVLATLAAALYAYVRLSLAPCALVLERTGITASLKRSGVLVKGDWWRVFGILLLVLVIAGFVSLTLQVPFEAAGAGGFGGLLDPERDVLSARALTLSAIGSILTTTLVSPFTAGARALLYVDRRMRAEGLDVALSAAAARQ